MSEALALKRSDVDWLNGTLLIERGIVPGNYALNLRQLYLLNTNYADLSFLFTILPGEKTNAHHQLKASCDWLHLDLASQNSKPLR
jgi:hypothetical protein